MNIIIENDLNLWEEIEKLENSEYNEDNNDICLLSNDKLTINYITLPCNHKFNYIPLYNELYELKINRKYNYYDKFKLRDNQIMCPYCRTVHHFLLP